MKFGCHVSIKDGYLAAANKASSIHAKAFQFFPKNPRRLTVKEFDKQDANLCKQFCEEHELISVCHAPYATTLTPRRNSQRKQVVASLHNDLEIADACGTLGVVVHFGSNIYPRDPLASYRLMIEVLDEVLGTWEGKAKLFIENNAGKAHAMGTRLEELVQIRNLSSYPEKIGFCFDTCHAFASGLWDGHNWDVVLKKGMDLGYFDHLDVIHFNNSKFPSGSGLDRHANIFAKGTFLKTNFLN